MHLLPTLLTVSRRGTSSHGNYVVRCAVHHGICWSLALKLPYSEVNSALSQQPIFSGVHSTPPVLKQKHNRDKYPLLPLLAIHA